MSVKTIVVAALVLGAVAIGIVVIPWRQSQIGGPSTPSRLPVVGLFSGIDGMDTSLTLEILEDGRLFLSVSIPRLNRELRGTVRTAGGSVVVDTLESESDYLRVGTVLRPSKTGMEFERAQHSLAPPVVHLSRAE